MEIIKYCTKKSVNYTYNVFLASQLTWNKEKYINKKSWEYILIIMPLLRIGPWHNNYNICDIFDKLTNDYWFIEWSKYNAIPTSSRRQ